ncbi:glutaredoxin domain-containing protein [Ditylenchus destructor]|nr:glutaredoxin domain-containing protein [Ditylenchus destructor]
MQKYVDHWLGYKRVCTFLDAKCPHCRQVKAAVDGLNFVRGRGGNIVFIEIEYREDNEDFREYLRELSGQRTLPQLFLDGTFYGDGDKILSAVADGTFEKKVREVGAL